jgi:N-glycosylase/DNA lyase
MRCVPVTDFDLAATLESGQIFRYICATEGYVVHHRHRVFRISQRGDTLRFDGVHEDFIRHFFGLYDNYVKIVRTLVDEETVKRAAALHWGLRILHQDPWECLISFLCSSAKNIAHIKVIVENLCRAFGEPVSLGSYQGYAFPREGAIDDLEKLEAIGLGFRARYIHEANRIVTRGYLRNIGGKPYHEARALLMELPGVGEKVANCVLLFSMGFLQAFPIDTWIKRGMEATYFKGEKTSSKRIGVFARQRFGPYAGYAQQFLYHYWRKRGRGSPGNSKDEI